MAFAFKEIYNTHYNLLETIVLANPNLVKYVAKKINPVIDLKSSGHALEVFNEWWEENKDDFVKKDRIAIYSIWEIVYWAKIEPGVKEGMSWYDSFMNSRCSS